MSRKVRAHILLFFTSFIWGSAFVAQSVGMEHLGPFTFNGVRMLISGFALTIVVIIWKRIPKTQQAASSSVQSTLEDTENSKKTLFRAGIWCGVIVFAASTFQQVGLVYTTAGKAGFLTTMYIILVPILGIFMKRKIGKRIWFCVILAVVGIYLLCLVENLRMNFGDFLMLFCALGYAIHIIVIDHFSNRVDAVRLSQIQFFVAGIISLAPMFIFETPAVSNILLAWLPLVYAAVLSGAIGFTFQIIAQKDIKPTVAALIMSFESVFAVLTGFVILSELLSSREILGCILMFTAVIIAQLPEKTGKDKLEERIQ